MGIAADNYRSRRHEAAYLATRPWIRGATVVEAGAGEGFGADILSRVARRVVAVDPDAAACEYAAKAYPALTVARASLTALPFADHRADAVVHLAAVPQPAFVAEAARILRPVGVLIVSTATTELSAAGLTEALAPHFRVDRLYGVHPRRRLRRPGAPVTHRDFHFGEEAPDTGLDLFALAIRR
ncbi:class I SAM-dependent methyltransferase [Cryptosporangium sp. NPDC051539]|uniref:class I SAM-dependent methyltransferase n=1 Tax=Cryptosporangium sp. NPDC051539 TaxID=3363962 RepID=UPI0037AC4861